MRGWLVFSVFLVGCSGSPARESLDEAGTGGIPSAGGGLGSGGQTNASGGHPETGGNPGDTGGYAGESTGGVSADGGTGGVAPSSGGTVEGGTGGGSGGAQPTGGVGGSDATGGTSTGGCTAVFFRDADGDSAGDPNNPVSACSAPPGYVANSLDCYDANPIAAPQEFSASVWFNEDRGDGSYDYDCDGEESGEFAVFSGTCNNISARSGWWDVESAPECGDSGQLMTVNDAYSCVSVKAKQQRCR